MQLDLLIAFFAIATSSFCAFRLGRALCRSGSAESQPRRWLPGTPTTLFVGTILFSLVFCWGFHADLGWANVFPFSSVVIWSNFAPMMLAFAGGVALESSILRPGIRGLIVGSLGLLAIGFLTMPVARPWLFAPPVSESNEFDGFVCLQTHDATCAPASAVTLLKLHGIETSEKELVAACLTSELGTEALGLYRGLKIASQKHGCRVRVGDKDPRNWLASGQLPSLALVHFPADEFGPIGSNARRSWSADSIRFFGDRAEGHAVVVVGREDGKWLVADPAIGLVKWSDETMRIRFTGDAIYLSE